MNLRWLAYVLVALVPVSACATEVVAPPETQPGEGGSEMGAGGSEADAYPLEGEMCDAICGGPACNFRCEDDVLYHCDGSYSVRDDCAARGLTCVFVSSDDPAGGEKLCQ